MSTPFTGSSQFQDYYTQLNKVLGLSTTANSTPAYMIPATPAAPTTYAPSLYDQANPTPGTPAAPKAPTVSAPAPAAPTSSTFPSAALQPGATGDSVKQLQDYLVSQGLMTRDQVNTGYGTYGPQTTAAVAALQQKLGVDNSSGVGYFGPHTIAALQGGTPAGGTPASGGTPAPATPTPAADPYAAERTKIAQDLGISTAEAAAFAQPSKTSEQVYNDAYQAAGLADLKSKITALTSEIAADRSKLTDAVGTINENPFLTEQSRVGRGKRLLDQAGQQIQNKLDNLTALQNLYNTGLQEVNGVVTRSSADFSGDQSRSQAKLNYLQTKAEQQYTDWTNTQKEPNLTGSADTGYFRYDPTTKKFVQVIAPSSSAQFAKYPSSYQEWVLAGRPGTYADFVKSKSSTNGPSTFNPSEAEKSLVQRFLTSDAGKAAGATPGDAQKATQDPQFFYYVLQQAIDNGYSTQI